jgi:hypothetical protein
MGVANLIVNVKDGQWGSAAVDVVGIIADSIALALPGVPGGAGAALRVSRATLSLTKDISSISLGVRSFINGINDGNPAAIVKGAAIFASVVLSKIAGKGFNRAGDYAFFTRYAEIGHITSAVATLLDGGVLTSDIIETVKKSIEQQSFFTFTDDEVVEIINDFAQTLTEMPIDP